MSDDTNYTLLSCTFIFLIATTLAMLFHSHSRGCLSPQPINDFVVVVSQCERVLDRFNEFGGQKGQGFV